MNEDCKHYVVQICLYSILFIKYASLPFTDLHKMSSQKVEKKQKIKEFSFGPWKITTFKDHILKSSALERFIDFCLQVFFHQHYNITL